MTNELIRTDEYRSPSSRSSAIWIKIDLDGRSTVLVPPEQCESQARARALLAVVLPKLEEITKTVEGFMRATETASGGPWL